MYELENKRASGVFFLSSLYDEIVQLDGMGTVDTTFTKYVSAMIWMLQKTIAPFFRWIESWLMLSNSKSSVFTNSLSSFDPYQEFFISSTLSHSNEIYYEVPTLLTKDEFGCIYTFFYIGINLYRGLSGWCLVATNG